MEKRQFPMYSFVPLADIGLGIFSAIFTSSFLKAELTPWILFMGVLFALIPDGDFLVHRMIRHAAKGKDHLHRDISHYPLIFIPVGMLLFAQFSSELSILFGLSSFLHFVHDSIGIGWGVKWLYPFSRKNFAFLYLYSKKEKKGLRRPLFSFDKYELEHYANEHGDDEWIRNIYYAWHPIVIVEFSIFLIALVTLLLFYVR